MDASSKLVLIGLMGAGKTTVAGALASRFGVRAIDTDALVEQKSGRTISEIFAESGEAEFRTLELEAVRTGLAEPGVAVLAFGGGAYMTPAVREACRGAWVVYLHAQPGALAARLQRTDLSTRPLLDADLLKRLTRLYEERDAVYRRASEVLETEGLASAEIVDVLGSRLQEIYER